MQIILGNRQFLEAYINEFNDLAKKASRKEFNKWTGARRNLMYENVLKYPKGNKHLEYFVTNPHPDRFSDTESFLFEAFNQPSQANSALSKIIEFENIRRFLDPKLSEFERELLSPPGCAAERN